MGLILLSGIRIGPGFANQVTAEGMRRQTR
jgi:hypothetical protein